MIWIFLIVFPLLKKLKLSLWLRATIVRWNKFSNLMHLTLVCPMVIEKKSMGDENNFWLLVRPRRLCFLNRWIWPSPLISSVHCLCRQWRHTDTHSSPSQLLCVCAGVDLGFGVVGVLVESELQRSPSLIVAVVVVVTERKLACFTMSCWGKLSQVVQELRIHCCQYSPSSTATRYTYIYSAPALCDAHISTK